MYIFVHYDMTDMPEKKEIELLLKNIQEGLKRYTVKELNDAIITFLNKKEDKNEEIDYIFQIVAEEYETNIRMLKKSNVRGILQEAKQIIYCILHFKLGLSTRYIAEKIFSNWHTSVHTGIRRFKSCDTNLKQDREFVEKYNLLSDKFIENFKDKTIKYEY
jgi:chromosomal replication initiation ATPase DnaA